MKKKCIILIIFILALFITQITKGQSETEPSLEMRQYERNLERYSEDMAMTNEVMKLLEYQLDTVLDVMEIEFGIPHVDYSMLDAIDDMNPNLINHDDFKIEPYHIDTSFFMKDLNKIQFQTAALNNIYGLLNYHAEPTMDVLDHYQQTRDRIDRIVIQLSHRNEGQKMFARFLFSFFTLMPCQPHIKRHTLKYWNQEIYHYTHRGQIKELVQTYNDYIHDHPEKTIDADQFIYNYRFAQNRKRIMESVYQLGGKIKFDLGRCIHIHYDEEEKEIFSMIMPANLIQGVSLDYGCSNELLLDQLYVLKNMAYDEPQNLPKNSTDNFQTVLKNHMDDINKLIELLQSIIDEDAQIEQQEAAG